MKDSLISVFILICLLTIYADDSFSSGNDSLPDLAWQQQQNIWWQNDEIIKEVIISSRMLKLSLKEEGNTDVFYMHINNVTNLLLLFDSLNTDQNLKILASLSSYYLGSHGSEVYSCLLLRKNNRIKPILKEMLESEDNECLARYKNKKENRDSKTPSMCLPDRTYRILLESTINFIEAGKTCTLQN